MMEIRDLLRGVRNLEARQQNKDLAPVVPVLKTSSRRSVLSVRDIIRDKIKQQRINNPVDATWLRVQLEAVLGGKSSELGPYDGVDGAWKGEPCFVVGASPGLRNAMQEGFKLSMLDGFHSIGVNHVVEDYHNFEWLFFLDKRFVDLCKLDLWKEYKGRMFAHVKTRLKPSNRVTIIYTQDDGPSENIVQGLYSFVASGLTAINLALVSGANPIYLIGLDTGGQWDRSAGTHYKGGYTGEAIGGNDPLAKFKRRVPELLLKYAQWADRFRNVDLKGNITVFPKISVRDIPELAGRWAS